MRCGVDAGNPICSSVTRAGSRIHSHARTTCTMSAGIRSSLSRYGWPTTRSASVSLCAIDWVERGGEGALRCLSIRDNVVSVVTGCARFFDLSRSHYRFVDGFRHGREKCRVQVTISRYYWWAIGWQQWIGGSVDAAYVRRIGWYCW